MSTTETRSRGTGKGSNDRKLDMKLEVVIIPVSDVDRSKAFYEGLGWRVDADIVVGDDFRIVQFTPPGSGCSVSFGKGVTTAPPGSAQGLELIVSDIEAAHDDLVSRGVRAGEVFHGSPFTRRLSGPDPQRQSYKSYASFEDPDGNQWILQEITTRLPGRVETTGTSFSSATDLAGAMRRAERAHVEHEKRTGESDLDWSDWYADYILAEQAGTELPT